MKFYVAVLIEDGVLVETKAYRTEVEAEAAKIEWLRGIFPEDTPPEEMLAEYEDEKGTWHSDFDIEEIELAEPEPTSAPIISLSREDILTAIEEHGEPSEALIQRVYDMPFDDLERIALDIDSESFMESYSMNLEYELEKYFGVDSLSELIEQDIEDDVEA